MDIFLLDLEFVLCHILKVEFVEMRESTVPAPDRKMPAANGQIMGTSHVAVSAFRCFNKSPEIVTPDFCECSRHRDILNTGNIDPGSAAVVTLNFSLVRNCFNNLVCNLPAMVTVSVEFCENKMFVHGKYWMRSGSLICCRISSRPQRIRIRKKEIAQMIAVNCNPGELIISSAMIRKNMRESTLNSNYPCPIQAFRISNEFLGFQGKLIKTGGINLITG